jgi:molybdenum cofactor biosynthesis enzyme MoaA
MPESLFLEVLKKLYLINPSPAIVNLTGIGEPLCHPDFFYYLATAKKMFPDAKLYLNTNGLLMEKYHDELIGSSLDLLGVSIRFADKERYKKFSGVDAYSAVAMSTKRVLSDKKRRFKVHVQVFSNENIVKFYLKWRLFCKSGDSIHFNRYYDLVGWYNGKSFEVVGRTHPCAQVNSVVAVDVYGGFHDCCEALWKDGGVSWKDCLRCPI